MDKIYKGAIFFDIDGTLIDLDNGIPTPPQSAVDAVRALRERGYLIGIATGRGMCYMPDGLADFEVDGYITSDGGNAQFHGRQIVDEEIPREVLSPALKFLDDNGCEYFISSGDECYYNNENNNRYAQMSKKMKPISSYPGGVENIRANKVNASYTAEFAEEFRKEFGDRLYVLEHRHNMAFGRLGVSKASAIISVINHYGINIEDTYAFGDDTNDVEMIAQVGHGVAMTPHVPELDGIAEYVTDSVGNDGIYKAFKHYGLV